MVTSRSSKSALSPKSVQAKPVVAAKPQKRIPAPPQRPARDAATAAEVSPKVKSKLVRDSFTIPKGEYQVLDLLKLRAINLKRPTKKSELLRAGIALLHTLSDSAFLAALDKIPSLQTGRPKAGK